MTFINNLKGYEIRFDRKAEKQLSKIDHCYSKSIRQKLNALVSGSQNLDVKKLAGYDDSTYRLRVGVYRVLYEVYERQIYIRVVSVEHRQGAYKF